MLCNYKKVLTFLHIKTKTVLISSWYKLSLGTKAEQLKEEEPSRYRDTVRAKKLKKNRKKT